LPFSRAFSLSPGNNKTKENRGIARSLRQRKNFNPDGWDLFSKVLGHLNVPEGIVRNENRLGIVREYKTKGIPDNLLTTARVQQEKRKKRRANISSPYKWLK
jgi:hypothetical protein